MGLDAQPVDLLFPLRPSEVPGTLNNLQDTTRLTVIEFHLEFQTEQYAPNPDLPILLLDINRDYPKMLGPSRHPRQPHSLRLPSAMSRR